MPLCTIMMNKIRKGETPGGKEVKKPTHKDKKKNETKGDEMQKTRL